MLYRGYSVLAVLALLLAVAGFGLGVAGLARTDAYLLGFAGVVALVAFALAQLSVLDE